jgi:hypothetical protein
MKNYPTIASFFAEQSPPGIEHFVNLNLDLSQRIYLLLEERGWTEADLACAVGLSEAAISLRLGGTYDWRLRELMELEEVLGERLIMLAE